MKAYLSLAVIAACSTARDQAVDKLGPGTRCVESSEKLAYCVDAKGGKFVCDKHDCLPAPNTSTLLEMDADRQRKDDEDAADQTLMQIQTQK